MKLIRAIHCIIQANMVQKTHYDSETPAHGQQVITACAFIHKKIKGAEKLFLPRRAHTKKFLPGVLELPGGHLNFGENIAKALKREIYEEFRIKIKVGDPFYAFTYINNIKGSHSVEVIYFATFAESLEKIRLNSKNHSEYIWIDENDIKSVYDEIRDQNDPELKAIKKGFSLLKGKKLNLG